MARAERLILIWIVCCWLTARTEGHYHLYIDGAEREKLFGAGLTGDLYYVQFGVINTYALDFVVTVKAPINVLTFTWQALIKHPVLYHFQLDYSDRDAMEPPHLESGMSLRGRIPEYPDTFKVYLPCTGRKAVNVDVLIQLNVTVSHQSHKIYNDTSVNLRRKKVCLFDDRPRTPPPQVQSGGNVGNGGSGPVLLQAAEGLYATGGLAFALFLLIAALLAWMCRRSSGSKMRPQECQYTSYASAYGSPPSVLVSKPPLPGTLRTLGGAGSDSDCGSYATIASFHKVGLTNSVLGGSALGGSVISALGTSRGHSSIGGSLTKWGAGSRAASPYATSIVATGGGCGGGSVVTRLYSAPPTESAYSSYSSYCPRRVAYYAASSVNSFGKPTVVPQLDVRLREPLNRVRLLSVPRQDLEPRTLLHEGTFGRVYRGLLRSRLGGRQEEVLIKTVTDQASELQVSVLLTEGLFLSGLSHEHILAPRAVSAEPGTRPILAYSSCNHGNLKRFLLNSRSGGEGHFAILTKDMVDMAVQVALGVAFLHSHRIWHKDIAARNCVVDQELRVKVADAGLARDLFPNDYHCLGDSDNRPIGWLAPESLMLRQFSAASDVWSWGVFLWELVTLAGQPYQEVDPFEMAAFLRDGYRLAQPDSCPDELFGLMAVCWITAPEGRPTMTHLLAGLHSFSATLGNYI